MKTCAAAVPLLSRPFYFMRHGETESNVRRTIAGSLDVELTARGHAQARSAALALANRGITEIYCSALRRSRDTANYIAATLQLEVMVIPALAECCWGVLEGQPRALRVRGVTPAGAETPQEFSRRVMHAFSEMTTQGTPLVVAHSGVFRVLCREFGVAEPAEPVGNAQPLYWRPPSAEHPAWRLELQ
jgi:probable phosphoglycerate mutase